MEFNDLIYSCKLFMLLNDKCVLDVMCNLVKLKSGYYEIVLLWKDDFFFFENNKIVVEYCLRLLKKCFLKDQELLVKYRECIEDLFKKGYVKKVFVNEIEGKIWYFFYYVVFYFVKLGKVCVVFDCFVKY